MKKIVESKSIKQQPFSTEFFKSVPSRFNLRRQGSLHEFESLFYEIRNSKQPRKPDEVKDLTNFYKYNPEFMPDPDKPMDLEVVKNHPIFDARYHLFDDLKKELYKAGVVRSFAFPSSKLKDRLDSAYQSKNYSSGKTLGKKSISI